MSEWLQTYNEMFGMYHAGIITTIFGAFAVTFTDRRIHGSRPYHRNILAGQS